MLVPWSWADRRRPPLPNQNLGTFLVRDWIEEFLSLTETIRSPKSFRLWTGISILAATLERRVWTLVDHPDPLFPNEFIILAGPAASGKTTMVSFARRMLVDLTIDPDKGLQLGPDNPNKASFLHWMAKANKTSPAGTGIFSVTPMTVLSRDLGQLMSKYDKDFAILLEDLYDCPPTHSAPRVVSKSITLDAPQVNILAAITPSALGDTMPDNVWDRGLASRIVFIYGVKPSDPRKMFRRADEDDKRIKDEDLAPLKTFLSEIFNELVGEFEWDDDAGDAMEKWVNVDDLAPKPDYGYLQSYCERRDTHVLKLSMISAVSAGHGLRVELSDFERARGWLIEAEKTMPDIFRAMNTKTDKQILDDVQHELWLKYSTQLKALRQPIKIGDIWKSFNERATSDKIPGLVTALEQTGRIRKTINPGEFIPNPPGATEEAHAQASAIITPFTRSGA
jgi:hypothetical protein